MSDAAFFAAFLRTTTAQADQFGETRFQPIQVLGSIPEADSLRHVVTRIRVTVAGMEIEAMEVVSLKKAGAGWKLLLQGSLKGLAQQIRQAFAPAGADSLEPEPAR